MMTNNPAEPPKNGGDSSGDESGSESHTEGSAGTNPRRSSAKRRIIDETLLDEDEARKLESRRAYNRKCAAKARKRSKDLISQLQDEVNQLNQDKATLQRTNEVMHAQMKLLEQQNQTLMMNQRQTESLLLSGMSGGVPGGLLSGLSRGGGGGGLTMGNFPHQGESGLSAAALLGSLTQRDRILANQILSNGLLSQQQQQQFPGGDPTSRGMDPNKRLH